MSVVPLKTKREDQIQKIFSCCFASSKQSLTNLPRTPSQSFHLTRSHKNPHSLKTRLPPYQKFSLQPHTLKPPKMPYNHSDHPPTRPIIKNLSYPILVRLNPILEALLTLYSTTQLPIPSKTTPQSPTFGCQPFPLPTDSKTPKTPPTPFHAPLRPLLADILNPLSTPHHSPKSTPFHLPPPL